jgi:hypothetical protein
MIRLRPTKPPGQKMDAYSKYFDSVLIKWKMVVSVLFTLTLFLRLHLPFIGQLNNSTHTGTQMGYESRKSREIPFNSVGIYKESSERARVCVSRVNHQQRAEERESVG